MKYLQYQLHVSASLLVIIMYKLNANLMMVNVDAETCSWYCKYSMYHFLITVVFWLINTFYDFVLNKYNGDDSPQSLMSNLLPV
jgi:hypothetical protein